MAICFQRYDSPFIRAFYQTIMFHVPNQFRIRPKEHRILGSEDEAGNNGMFKIPLEDGVFAYALATDGLGWQHVSVHIVDNGKEELPTWEEMCLIKDMFWDKEARVVQYHPPHSEYVNDHETTLHLWRPIAVKIPAPPKEFVGGFKMKK